MAARETVYLDYDAETLYAEYNNSGKVDDRDAFVSDWDRRSDDVRSANPDAQLDLAYGEGPRETFDLFLPDADAPPLFAFIHGGYWQWNEKESFAFLAEPFLDAGIAFANIEYPLCPSVDLPGLVERVRRAFAHLWRHGEDLGYDRDNILVSGHSAGGHLTGIVMTTDWPAFADDLPHNPVRSAMPISGVFDIEPIRHTPIGDPLGLDAEKAAALSPMIAPPRTGANTVVTLGAHEGREFHRQAELFAQHCRNQGVSARIESVFGENHFSVLDSLASADGLLFRTARELLES